MYVTGHAGKRIKQRCGLPKRAIRRNAELALQHGIRHCECVGRLKRYVDGVFLLHRRGAKMRIYKYHVYIFTTDETLVTVLPLPTHYRKLVDNIKCKVRSS